MTAPSERNGTAAPLWRMRVLSGLHAGAEAILADDEDTTIGSDDDCDLVLHDDGLGERHIHLSVADAGVRLTVLDLDQPVFVDGRKVDEAADLQPYQVVAFGRSSFALGPVGQAWPIIEIPDIEAEEPGNPGEQPPRHRQNGSLTKSRINGVGRGAAAAAEAPPARPRFRHRFRPHPAIVGGLALFVSMLAAWLLVPKEIPQSVFDPDAAQERIRAMANRYGALVEVTSDGPEGQRISVTGSIGTTRDRQRFLDELAGTGIQATAWITASEDIARIASLFLDQALNWNRKNRVTVRALDDSPNTLLVSGYVEKERDLSAAMIGLERDSGDQVRFRYEVQTKKDRIRILKRRLEELGFEYKLRVQELENGISLFGPCPDSAKMAELTELTKRFNEEFNARPRLRLTGNERFLGESTIDLDIRAVVLGDREHVVLHDGKSYAEGSTIDNGYRIQTIEPEFIVLEKPRTLVTRENGERPDIAYYVLGQR